MQRGEHPRQQRRRIRGDAPVDSGVEIGGRAMQLELHGDNAAQPVSERRGVAGDHPGIGNGNDVRLEFVPVFHEERLQVVAAAFFFAFHQKDHVYGQIVLFLKRLFHPEDVRKNLPFVVRRTPSENQPITHVRLEGRGGPLVERVHRLHIVMAVDEDRAASRLGLVSGHHHRMTASRIGLRLQAHAGEFFGQPFGAGRHMQRVVNIGRDALKAKKLEELV